MSKKRERLLFCLLCVIVLVGAVWIYCLTGQIRQYEAAVSALEEEIDELLHPKDGVLHNGWLSLRGTYLVNEHGEPLQLRGVSSHGVMWYPEYGNYRAIATTKENGANVFRAAMYTTENGGYDKNPGEASRTLKAIVENALGADMYVIVDWHVLKEKTPNVYVEEAVRFFNEISRLYADEPGVIYEICNEPNGDTGWEDIKAYAERVIPVIRANSPNALILVGTPNYCVDIKKAADDPLPYENIMYTYHYYAAYDQGGYEYSLSYVLERGSAVFVSEWGIGGSVTDTRDDADCNTGEEQDAQGILNFLDEQGIRELDYLFLTHPDKDHIGSAPEVVRALKVHTAVEPYYRKANDQLEILNRRLSQENIKLVTPSRVLHYSFDDTQIFVYPPLEKHYNDDNNYSLGILIKHGDVNLFFPGDAEEKRLTEMLELDLPQTALFKLPHHGRYHDAAAEMLRQTSPAFGIVTSKEASDRLSTICRQLGTELFFTAGKTVRFISNGTDIQPFPNQ